MFWLFCGFVYDLVIICKVEQVNYGDLHPTSRVNLNSGKSVTMQNDGYEEEQIQQKAHKPFTSWRCPPVSGIELC
jgi:hypothetical protein